MLTKNDLLLLLNEKRASGKETSKLATRLALSEGGPRDI